MLLLTCSQALYSDKRAAAQDYSKNTYDLAWSKDCWWDKPVVVYGAAGLKKDHPVVQFLARDNHAKTLAIYREG